MTMALLDPGTRTLDEIAESIRSHLSVDTETRFALGRDLADARAQFPGDREFGQWVDAQGFSFTRQWRSLLIRAAEHEPEVRTVLESQLSSGRTPNIEKALTAVLHPEVEPDTVVEIHATDVDISPEYRALMRAMKEFLDLRSTVNTVRMNWTPDQKRLLQERAESVIRLARHIHSPQAGRISLEVPELT